MVIDCFSFFKNLDLLEIRLNSLAPYVDRFVLVESPYTFNNEPKSLYYELQKDRFSAFNISHLVFEPTNFKNPVDRIWEQFKFMLANLPESEDDSMVLVSDTDNIPNLKDWDGEEGIFIMERYYYRLNCYYQANNWRGTEAIRKKHLLETLQEAPGIVGWHKRLNRPRIIHNGGWHFCCLGTIEDILLNFASNGHQKINTPQNLARICDNFNNRMHPLHGVLKQKRPRKLILQMPSGPDWLLQNKDRYKHLFYEE